VTTTCDSCSMPIETGPYCEHCTDENGQLQSFDERFERMLAWSARKDPAATREQLEASTLAFMATRPAWAQHPRVTGRAGHGAG